jgi:hypothetical protein
MRMGEYSIAKAPGLADDAVERGSVEIYRMLATVHILEYDHG